MEDLTAETQRRDTGVSERICQSVSLNGHSELTRRTGRQQKSTSHHYLFTFALCLAISSKEKLACALEFVTPYYAGIESAIRIAAISQIPGAVYYVDMYAPLCKDTPQGPRPRTVDELLPSQRERLIGLEPTCSFNVGPSGRDRCPVLSSRCIQVGLVAQALDVPAFRQAILQAARDPCSQIDDSRRELLRGRSPLAVEEFVARTRAELACDIPSNLRVVVQWTSVRGSGRFKEFVFERGELVETLEKQRG